MRRCSTQPDFCRGERCNFHIGSVARCGEPAKHKVGEERDTTPDSKSHHQIFHGHNLTAYLCCAHFEKVMGPAAHKP